MSKNPSAQTSASQTSSSWISASSTPLSRLVAQVLPIESQYLLRLCLCPPLPRRPHFVLHPLPQEQSRNQHELHRSLTAIIPSSFPLGKTLDYLTMLTIPTLSALVRHEINSRTNNSVPCQASQVPTSALRRLMGKLLAVPTSPSQRVSMLAYSPNGKSTPPSCFHAVDGSY